MFNDIFQSVQRLFSCSAVILLALLLSTFHVINVPKKPQAAKPSSFKITMANLTSKCYGLPECLFGVFIIRFFVKNRELRPGKNKFAFALGKLTVELDEIQ